MRLAWPVLVIAVVFVAAIAIVVSKNHVGAKLAQYGIIIAIVVLVLRHSSQIPPLISNVTGTVSSDITQAQKGKTS